MVVNHDLRFRMINLRNISIEGLNIKTKDFVIYWEDINNDTGLNYNGYGFVVEDVYQRDS